jgi:hypothetical protein
VKRIKRGRTAGWDGLAMINGTMVALGLCRVGLRSNMSKRKIGAQAILDVKILDEAILDVKILDANILDVKIGTRMCSM